MSRTPSWRVALLIVALVCPALVSADPPPYWLYLPVVSRPADSPVIDNCPAFPADHIWNARVDSLPVDPRSNDYIASIGANTSVHPDFGSGLWNNAPIGIPYAVVSAGQPGKTVTFTYASESDPGLYPIPPGVPIEGGPDSKGDRHILIIDRDACKLYELFAAYPNPDGSWRAGSGAIFDLRTYALRPAGWTSADAAGLPIFPGLARYEEIAAGAIRHALRFTAPLTRKAYVWPARHYASDSTSASLPPMGQRFRLKNSFNTATFSPEVQIFLRALKEYGLILADNGSAWYISGVPNAGWNNDVWVGELARLKGSDFEAVDSSSLMKEVNSGQVR